jgi:hypothetical protein
VDRTGSLEPWLDWYNLQGAMQDFLRQAPIEAPSPFTGNDLMGLHN